MQVVCKVVDIKYSIHQEIYIATMQCAQRGPALSMHIVNFPSKRAPILCKFTCIRKYQPISLY